MDQILEEFYVSLPSNSSMDYFPENTQASYRTKLSSPLMLSGEWEVALTEIFMSRNWFNIGKHNNGYSVDIVKEESSPIDMATYDVQLPRELGKDVDEFWLSVNREIQKEVDIYPSVLFAVENGGEEIRVNIASGFELLIEVNNAPKLFYMFHLPNENITISTDTVFKFRPTTQSLDSHVLTIINRNPKSVTKHVIPFTVIKQNIKLNKENIFNILNANIALLELENHLSFDYKPLKNEVEIKTSNYGELHITSERSNSLMQILNIKSDTVLKGTNTLSVNPLLQPKVGEIIELHIKEYFERKYHNSYTENLTINVGMYKSAERLFKEFKYINLQQLPNLRIKLHVPEKCEVRFGVGLADMLGFSKTRSFKSGDYISDYPLELDGGITEIFVYTDIIASHHVGDSFSPLLRVIPCINEKEEQIVKHYNIPIYFPLRKHFIETIEIELKTSSGEDIIFTGGKTFALLSFRRRKL